MKSASKPVLHGLEALSEIGMPHEFAAQVMLFAETGNFALSVRGGQNSQLYDTNCAPKPFTTKQKTGTWGLTKGVIPKDIGLGRYARGRPVNGMYSRDKNARFLQHQVTLKEILINSVVQDGAPTSSHPEFEIDIKGNELYILVINPPQPMKKGDLLFKINLLNSREPVPIEKKYFRTRVDEPGLKKPKWWKEEWGEFEKKILERYPVFLYSKKTAKPDDKSDSLKTDDEPGRYIPLLVQAVEDEKNVSKDADDVGHNLLVITGDMDILWIGRPLQPSELLNAMRKKAHDAKAIKFELDELLNVKNDPHCADRLLSILKVLGDENKYINEKESLTRIKNFGCITPFEAYVIETINQRFNHFVAHFENLFQHGAENRNPGDPSDLDGDILHLWRGEITLTRDESQLVNFVLTTPGYLENNFITIHPKWNMELWAPVVGKQLELGQPVDEKVMAAYTAYVDRGKSPLQRITSTLVRSAQRRLSGGNKMVESLRRSSDTVKSQIVESVKRFSLSNDNNASDSTTNSPKSPDSASKRSLANSDFFNKSPANSPRFTQRKTSVKQDAEIKGACITIYRKKSLEWSIKDSFIELENRLKLQTLAQAETRENCLWQLHSNKELEITFHGGSQQPEVIRIYLTSDSLEIITEVRDAKLDDVIRKLMDCLLTPADFNNLGITSSSDADVERVQGLIAHPSPRIG